MNVVLNARDAMPDGVNCASPPATPRCRPTRTTNSSMRSPAAMSRSTSPTPALAWMRKWAHIFEPSSPRSRPLTERAWASRPSTACVANRGLVTVYSEPGQGTLFRIYLARGYRRGYGGRGAVDVEVLRGDETLLVVEDAENLRDLIAAILESFGYGVYTASEARRPSRSRQHRDEIDS